MNSNIIALACCDYTCLNHILYSFDENKLTNLEVSSLLGKVQLSAGVRQLVDLGDESCLVFHSSMSSSLEPCSNGRVYCVASGVEISPFLAIVRDNLVRPELTARCLLCVVTSVTTRGNPCCDRAILGLDVIGG